MNTVKNKNLSRSIMAIIFLASVMASSLTWAPYGYDPAAHQNDAPGNVYFGSAKDTNGDFVAGATIVLDSKKVGFVTVTDATGRFRLELPTDMLPADVTPRCSRKDYKVGEIVKRLPPAGAPTPVEVNCVLNK